MTEVAINPGPGITFSQSYYAAGKDIAYISQGAAFRQGQSRWDNGYNVEFVAGYPQKIAGWSAATATVLTGAPRACMVWRDNLGVGRVAIGTQNHLYYLLDNTVTDITPLRTIVSGSLSGPISTTNNSVHVTIADTGAELAVHDWVFLQAASAVGGVTLNGWYSVTAVNPGTDYTIVVASPATSTAGPAGGSTSYQYPRTTLSNPFTTTNGSPVVTVAHTAHGALAGNYVVFSGASAVAGLTLNGEFSITSIVDADHYKITASSNANTGTTGGGSVSVIYLVPFQQQVSTDVGAYGDGNYGDGIYSGIGSSALTMNGWTLAAYGYQLLACPIGGTIYVYDPVYGGRAYCLLNAPASINAMFVTPERFVVAVGVNNAMQIAWADQNDYTQWVTTLTNTAETGRTIVGGSFLVGGIAVRPGVSLLFSDRCVFTMTYSGAQFIYTTQQAGDNCGLVAANAVCAEGGTAYWMSDFDFWTWNGSASALPTDDIRSYVFGPGNLNRAQLSKCTVMANRKKRQVRFFYPAGSSAENNLGMIFHYDQNCWAPLNFGRACGTDANLLATPVSCDQGGNVYYDEVGTDANGVALPWLLQLALMDVSNGDRGIDVFGFIPDWQSLSGSPDLNILTQYYPSQAITVDGPYTLDAETTRQDLRSDGKLVGFSISDNELGSTFRLGLPRLDIAPAGARR